MQSQYGNGALAERLGTGLQNLLQRFDSARHLTKPLSVHSERGLFVKWYYIGTTFCCSLSFWVLHQEPKRPENPKNPQGFTNYKTTTVAVVILLQIYKLFPIFAKESLSCRYPTT